MQHEHARSVARLRRSAMAPLALLGASRTTTLWRAQSRSRCGLRGGPTIGARARWMVLRSAVAPPDSERASQSGRTQTATSIETAAEECVLPTPPPAPATTVSDFTVSATQLQQLVQEAFDSRGAFREDVAKLAGQLRSSPLQGLSHGGPQGPKDAGVRMQAFGVNRLPEPPSVSFLQLVWEALQDRTLVLLMLAGGVSLALAAATPDADASEWIEAAAILASVLIVVSVSSVTNYHKESKFRALNALKDEVQVRVIRGGEERSVSTHSLLVGDVLVVETGDILPADGVLVAGEDLKIDESHMTGEPDDVMKSMRTGNTIMLAGSKVREGYGRMLVLAVGHRSQQGQLASMVLSGKQGLALPVPGFGSSAGDESGDAGSYSGNSSGADDEGAAPGRGGAASDGGGRRAAAAAASAQATLGAALREDTLLTEKLKVLADLIGGVGVGAAVLVFGANCAGYLWHLVLAQQPVDAIHLAQAFLDFFITGITILVVAVPEGLPLAVTLALAFSVQRMLKDNNLVRHLDACETMASATTICSDKTGTLTANDMTVVQLWAGGGLFAVPTKAQQQLQQQQQRAAGGRAAQAPGRAAAEPDCGCPSPAGGQAAQAAAAGLPGPALLEMLLQGVLLNCTATIKLDPATGAVVEKIGNSTECALLEWATRTEAQKRAAAAAAAASSHGGKPAASRAASSSASASASAGDDEFACTPREPEAVVLQALPFTSERKRMSALVVLPEDFGRLKRGVMVPCRLLTKGGADVVLDRCSHQLDASGQVVPLPASSKQRLLDQFTRNGLRTLALAFRDLTLPSHVLASTNGGPNGEPVPAPSLKMPADHLETSLVLVGLMGLQDPLRPDVAPAIEQCQRAGITVRMLTGDNARTASCIARECRILPPAADVDAVLRRSQQLVGAMLADRRAHNLGQPTLAAAGGAGALPLAARLAPPAASSASAGSLTSASASASTLSSLESAVVASASASALGGSVSGGSRGGGGGGAEGGASSGDWDVEVEGGPRVWQDGSVPVSLWGGTVANRRVLGSLDEAWSDTEAYGEWAVSARSYDDVSYEGLNWKPPPGVGAAGPATPSPTPALATAASPSPPAAPAAAAVPPVSAPQAPAPAPAAEAPAAAAPLRDTPAASSPPPRQPHHPASVLIAPPPRPPAPPPPRDQRDLSGLGRPWSEGLAAPELVPPGTSWDDEGWQADRALLNSLGSSAGSTTTSSSSSTSSSSDAADAPPADVVVPASQGQAPADISGLAGAAAAAVAALPAPPGDNGSAAAAGGERDRPVGGSVESHDGMAAALPAAGGNGAQQQQQQEDPARHSPVSRLISPAGAAGGAPPAGAAAPAGTGGNGARAAGGAVRHGYGPSVVQAAEALRSADEALLRGRDEAPRPPPARVAAASAAPAAAMQGSVVASAPSAAAAPVREAGGALAGLLRASAGLPLVLEGPQFRELVQLPDGTLDLEALRAIWPDLRVIARCSPADKYLLVRGLKQLRQLKDAPGSSSDSPAATSGNDADSDSDRPRSRWTPAPSSSPSQPPQALHEVIAMTGDGTNDAPALSAADVGFAMNSGTSIAKDAADILLMDNSFSSIVSAVKWGRNVYASVTKFLQFQLTANVVAVVTAGVGALAFARSPLSAVQMLWVNLLMDSLASLALATESPSDELLDLPPVSPDEPLVTPVVAKHIMGQAAVQLAVLAGLVLHGEEWFGVDLATRNTLVFNTFVCMQLFNQFNCRKVRDEPHVFSGVLSHPLFCGIVAAEALMQVAIVQYGGSAFQTAPLTPAQWAACVGLGATTLLVREALRRVPTAPGGGKGGGGGIGFPLGVLPAATRHAPVGLHEQPQRGA